MNRDNAYELSAVSTTGLRSSGQPALRAVKAYSRDFKFSHLIIYLGILTTAFAVAIPEVTFVYRFAYVNLIMAWIYFVITGKLRFNRQINTFCLLALLVSLVSVLREKVPFYEMLVASVGLFAYSTVLSSYFAIHEFDVYKVFPHYIRIAMIASYLAIAQQILYLVGFVPGYDLSWLFIGAQAYTTSGPMMRAYSFFTEPGYFAVALTPVVFLAVNRLLTGSKAFLNKRQATIIIVGFLCSFSGLAYVALFLSAIVVLRSRLFAFRLRSVIMMVLFGGFLLWFLSVAPAISTRVDAVLGIVASENITGYENSSVLIMYTNFAITKDAFLENPFIGSGLGSSRFVSLAFLSHQSLEPGLERLLGFMRREDMGFQDASTLYFKLSQELGLLGWIAVLWFLLSNRVKSKSGEYNLLQNMCLVFLVVFSLRTGQYNRFELWYFICLYYCIKQYHDNQIAKSLPAGGFSLARQSWAKTMATGVEPLSRHLRFPP